MKTTSSLALAVALAYTATSTAHDANLRTKSVRSLSSASPTSLRGASSSAPAARNLQEPSYNAMCYTQIGYRSTAQTTAQITCTPELLKWCSPFDFNCVPGVIGVNETDVDDETNLGAVPCRTFAVLPSNECANSFSYTCC
jgi:hypothetical protein